MVRRIFTSYSEGLGYKRIAVVLNEECVPAPGGGSWDVSAIRSLLRNEVYRGWLVLGKTRKVRTLEGKRTKVARPAGEWIIAKGAHPAIIPDDLWDRVHQRLYRVTTAYQAAGLRTCLPPAIADHLRFSERAEEYLVASRSTGVHALGDRPEARHGKAGGPKDRARRSPKTRTPPQAEFHPRGLCSVARRPNRKSWLKRYGQPCPSGPPLMGAFYRVLPGVVKLF